VTTRHSRPPSGSIDGGDYYKLLGVPYTATFQGIARAYREAMKRAHPDRQRPERRAAAEELAKELNRAFTTLSKAESRRAYDSTIKASAIQEQIMGRYVTGNPMGGGPHDPFAESLRRPRTRAERADQRRADRSATASIFLVFGAIALLVIAFVLVAAVVEALFDAFV
jgi:DnaJ-class molecular chaperone